MPASLRCATGSLRCSGQPGASSNSPAAQTIARPFPSGPALLSAFTRVWGTGSGSDSGQVAFVRRYYFHSCLGTYYLGYRPKTLKKSWCNLVFGVRSQFRCAAPAGRVEGAANLGSDLKMPASESEFIPQTPCGRAEQRRLGRIKILDVRRPRSGLVSKISAPDEQRKESRSDPDFGSPFFGLPYFGEAKKGESPAAATERLWRQSKSPMHHWNQSIDRPIRNNARRVQTIKLRLPIQFTQKDVLCGISPFQPLQD